MKYCKRCIIPDTRPNISFNSAGICNACATHDLKPTINWPERERTFRQLVQNAKTKKDGYDCLIPVSGGKDSTWQVVTCLEYGLTPLAVTWKTPARTELGAQNLANLIRLGVDHIDYQINPNVEKKFLYAALTRYGSTAIPMHMALFNIPLTLAAKYQTPLVIYGENSASEYGGKEELQGYELNAAWLKTYGVTHGTTAEDWVSETLTRKELSGYFSPSEAELKKANVKAIFLGQYFRWDPEISLQSAKEHGFRVREAGPKTGYYNFADIDDDFISIHHFLKWYKFGFTRSYDNLSVEIRNNRMTRAQAIDWLRSRGDETPTEDIQTFCRFVGITEDHFFQVIEKFRNPSLWELKNGTHVIKDFLIPDWRWQ